MTRKDFLADGLESIHHEEALSFEASRIDMIQKSERRAWRSVYITLGALFFSWVAIAVMMPLNREVLYLIRVDNSTGATDVVKVLDDDRVTYDDVIDKYWVAQFVRARERYDWWTLRDDHKEVRTMAASDVWKEYDALFDGDEALQKIYNRRYKVTVGILSIVPNRGIATVRISKTIESVESASGDVRRSNNRKYIATLGYVYRNPSKMSEELRLLNPLGFQVMSYRLDPELAASPLDQQRQQTIAPPPPEQPQVGESEGGLPN
jgi:type IV secretory pathway component VirB8